MVSVIPVKEKKLRDVKIGELPSWTLMWDFIPKGIDGAYQRGYYKCINAKKGNIAGVFMVLATYVLFNYCLSEKELKFAFCYDDDAADDDVYVKPLCLFM
ncbi:ATP synthase subunit f, mitochondrial-like isoform 1 [Camelus ferus]|nr:ATP synthase subunit f, mitochondrial-like isoform 1 [Camelus ferus]